MKIKVCFSETKNFYAKFRERTETIPCMFGEINSLYIGEYPLYNGPYRVVPKIGDQFLRTAQTALEDDITVYAIPYAEVSNLSGGMTATIGGN